MGKKMNCISGIFRSRTKKLTFISWDPRQKGQRVELKTIFKEIMGENFLNLAKDLALQIQEAEQTPSRLKTKKKTLKAARDKSCIIYGEDQFKLGHISHLKPWRPEGSDTRLYKY